MRYFKKSLFFLVFCFFISPKLWAANPQMVNLNLKILAKNVTLNSVVAVPFFQKAEISTSNEENSNSYMEVNPTYGTNENEVLLDLKFYRMEGIRHLLRKKIVAKLGEESRIAFKGVVIKLTPVL